MQHVPPLYDWLGRQYKAAQGSPIGKRMTAIRRNQLGFEVSAPSSNSVGDQLQIHTGTALLFAIVCNVYSTYLSAVVIRMH